MPLANRSKVVPYILVVPSPFQSLPPPLFSPAPSPIEQTNDDDNDRRRNTEAGSFGKPCNCISSFLAGLGLISLLAVAIAIPIVINLSMSTSATTAVTTVFTTIPTTTTLKDTTTTTTTTKTTSTTVTTTTTTTTSGISTNSTTSIPCVPVCNSQQTCVDGVCVGIGYLSITMTWSRNGDGDLVVATPNNNIIYYGNRGPSSLTDQGELDVDNTLGKGPENAFWSSGGPAPPIGVYYVCFSQYSFTTAASFLYPITATAQIVRSTNSTLTFTKVFTTTYKDTTQCGPSSSTLLGSFTYP